MFTSTRAASVCVVDPWCSSTTSPRTRSRARNPSTRTPPRWPSGTLAGSERHGVGHQPGPRQPAAFDLAEPWGHASLGQLGERPRHAPGNGAVYDDGPGGNDDIGALGDLGPDRRHLTRVIIGPKTGYIYPPTSHISATGVETARSASSRRSGTRRGRGSWISRCGSPTRTRSRLPDSTSWGKDNTHLQEPSGGRPTWFRARRNRAASSASDWGNGADRRQLRRELPDTPPAPFSPSATRRSRTAAGAPLTPPPPWVDSPRDW